MDTIGDVASVAQLSGVDAVGLISMIVRSASTARTHRKNCVEFAQHLKVVGDLLEKLDVSELKRHRETREPLEQLEEALRRSFVLVDSCRGMSYLYLLAMGWNVGSQFRKAREEIDWYLRLIPLISLVDRARARDSRLKNIPQQDHCLIDLKVESGHDQSKVDQQNDMMDAKGVKADANPDVHYGEFPSNTYTELREIAIPTVSEDNKSDALKRRQEVVSWADIPTSHERRTSPSSEGEVSLPGIGGFQITGEATPGSTLRACGYATNGTSLCIFQWVRHIDIVGTKQLIEGATMPEYVVTADDVGTILAVDCIPIDDSGRQGRLVHHVANNQNKVVCDPAMQYEIDAHISAGSAVFTVFLLMDFSEERAHLILAQNGYRIRVISTNHVVMEEKYSPDLYVKLPNGQSTQFTLMCSEGSILPFNTSRTLQEYDTNNIRLRDSIVLTLRHFQAKAVGAKGKGQA
ncbi:uncharacterized protein LOC109825022 isoform X2 [Asparagus officinalis]|uniref:uncharacterized protein LOC109825022 isoform X2 n=1 Tax=Asparagus officinalis TaxID=4686 RepID=UPI00098E348A|nr:uncharacterized protein LOC109825022 isoform X2 [Asparagus officinalis]